MKEEENKVISKSRTTGGDNLTKMKQNKSALPRFIELVYWLTERFEELSAGKLSIEEQCVIDGVIGPTHTDQKDIQAACGQMHKT